MSKTFIGSEKLNQLNNRVNLCVCQKSKIKDWIDHFVKYYPEYTVKDLTKDKVVNQGNNNKYIGVINYDLVYRRSKLSVLKNFTLMLDESSVIANEKTKRSKFILKMNADNVILLSGTPVSGKYEKLYSQAKLLGWNITKMSFYDRYIITKELPTNKFGFPLKIVVGYKNVEELKSNFRKFGAVFKKTEEVIDLPEQNVIDIKVANTKEYKVFQKDSIVQIGDKELVGDNSLTKLLCCRQLCSQYNKNKIEAFKDLLNETNDRLIVFYNFNTELDILKSLVDRKISIVNGSVRDLENYEKYNDSVTFVQYQSGSKGLNLQLANKIIYFSATLSCENYMQSLKRVHRIGQKSPCFYYRLITEKSVDEKIYEALAKGVDYTDRLFVE